MFDVGIAPAGPEGAGSTLFELPGGVPGYETIDPRFGDCIDLVSQLEVLYTGCRWAEGPVYFAELQQLLFSDIPNRRMLRYDEVTGQVSLFRPLTGNANGNTRDRTGRLITCEQGARRVIRTEYDGSVTVVADSFAGKRLNSPNDVVVSADGSIWFTDPTYGLLSDFVGNREPQEQATCNVFRIAPDGTMTIVADDFWKPNGLAFSPDESKLYVADSGLLPDPDGPHHIRVFDVHADGRLTGGEVLAEISPGIPDGLRVDDGGRVWVGAGDGVHCISPEGELLGKIRLPEACANLTFGGPKRNRLYMTATTSLYAVFLNVRGVQRP